jgi:7-cyano-7-deazaguanine tRNA-ribosyltransferase
LPLKIVAGLNLKSLKPRVWDPDSDYYLHNLQAVMFSYADFHRQPARRRAAMEQGIHALFGIPTTTEVYLDNGAFYFLNQGGGETHRSEYEEFVESAKPDWCAIPQDFIPTPKMNDEEQRECLNKTMSMNLEYQHNGFVPVIHISRLLGDYLEQFQAAPQLLNKEHIGLGGVVPNLLRASKAMPYKEILNNLRRVRSELHDKELHVFGIGGTATVHLAALLDIDSVDSSGWRNRAARGMIQLPGSGERIATELGKWRGRAVSDEEWDQLTQCSCPACQRFGVDGLKANKAFGFHNRATHNLWVLLNEARLVEEHLTGDTYAKWYETHLDNSIYRPLIQQILQQRIYPDL